METEIQKAYTRRRASGAPAWGALRCAKLDALWDACSALGLVRLDVVPDEEPYDDSYLDTWGETPARVARLRSDLQVQIESSGVWGVQTFARQCCGHLHEIDACWGFIGDEFGGYDDDLKLAALFAIS